jgi:serine/threonine-protein kinase RsbW
MHEGSIKIRLRAEVPEVERLNRIIRQFGELHEIPCRTLYAVNLAIDELVSNAILYAFDNPISQEVVVTIEVSHDRVSGSVEDGGREFDPLLAEPANVSLPLQERSAGGLGIHLVRTLMDEVNYQRTDKKNILTVCKRIR